jgi:multidrug resistance efflux pump
MPAKPTSPNLNPRTAILLEAIALLVDELALLAAEDWDRLPDLKKRKAVMARQLRHLRAETGAADGTPKSELEYLISQLEAKSRSHARARLNLIGNQLVALQELSLYLRESLHVKLRKTSTRPLGKSGILG